MSSLDYIQVKQKIVGAWELPLSEDYSETLIFHGGSGRVMYVCSVMSQGERLRQQLEQCYKNSSKPYM